MKFLSLKFYFKIFLFIFWLVFLCFCSAPKSPAGELHELAKSGDVPLMISFLNSKRVNVDLKDDKDRTALYWASAYCNFSMVKLLISKKANVNAKDEQDVTPLHRAITAGCLDVVKYLVEKGADIYAQDHNKQNPLYYTAYWATRNEVEMAEFLLLSHAQRGHSRGESYVNLKNDLGNTALHHISSKNKLELAKVFVNYGARNIPNPNGHTPFSIARVRGYMELLEFYSTKGFGDH